jgi:hypothetical protein|tara:strand:- start:2110 stop:2418 length:309 start_codon:yes stop_codon:yes gene_type:complete
VEAVLESLLADGHLGVFAAFLIYQFVTMQKRLDALVEGFQKQLKEINDEYDGRIEKMRERYDAVIKEARAETAAQAKDFLNVRNKIQEQIVSKLDVLTARSK